MKLFVLIDEQGDQVLSILAREALAKAAESAGLDISLSLSPKGNALRIPAAQTRDDVLLVVGDGNHPIDARELQGTFDGAHIDVTTVAIVLEQADKLIEDIIKAAKQASQNDNAGNNNTDSTPATPRNNKPIRNIVAVTSCPTGIAHTFMAADALSEGAKNLGLNIRVETQGSVGAGTPLTAQEIADADLVIIAADREVDRARFAKKRIYVSGTRAAINNGAGFIKEAIHKAKLQAADEEAITDSTDADEEKGGGIYRHLMTGVSFMLPFVVAGGLLIALSLAIGGIDVAKAPDTFAYMLNEIGSKAAFALMVPILAGYIAFSIADRPGLAPGMIGGLVAQQLGAGFIGGILAGFLAGYVTLAAIRYIRLPRNLAGLMPVLVLPLIGTLITGLVLVYVIGQPVASLNAFLTTWLKSLDSTNAAVLGLLLGAMMAVDMGGPINKAAYAFSTALVANGLGGPMAATMIGGMVPPIALACATWVFPNRFTTDERNSKGATFILGLAFISEGAIPFAARDPLRVIPSLIIGSAVAGGVAMASGTQLSAPHGGIFLMMIPGVINNYFGYLVAIVSGVLVSTMFLGLLKQPIAPDTSTPAKGTEAL